MRGDNKICVIKHHHLMQYANCEMRSKSYVYDLIMKMVPNLSKFSMSRRNTTVDSFQEVIHEAGTLLAVEDTYPKFVYLLLKGEVALYKRAEQLYNDKGKKID